MESAASRNKESAVDSLARVTETSRRFISLKTPDSKRIPARSTTKTIETVVGDFVRFTSRGGDTLVEAILPRRNELKRGYGKQLRPLAANLDLLVIVCAVQPLFNVSFIDRISLAAISESIPYVIVLNKIDLGMSDTESELRIYRELKCEIVCTSAADGRGLDLLAKTISSKAGGCVALAGISGVGKSSLLNCLVPCAASKTNQVSKRTGQGKQTTSRATAYDFAIEGGESVLIIDLPGFSTFGVGHLHKEEVRFGFPEFARFGPACRYADCYHIDEPHCAVKQAIHNGEMSASRYRSYLDILKEIEAARPY